MEGVQGIQVMDELLLWSRPQEQLYLRGNETSRNHMS